MKDKPNQPTSPVENTADETENSVDEYMMSLIKRLRDVRTSDDDSDQAAQPAAGKSSPAASSTLRPEPIAPNTDAEGRPIPGRRRMFGNFETLPRRGATPPESPTDLSLLRQVANQHAREVIETHSTELNGRYAYTKLAIAFLGIGASFAVLRYSRLDQPLPLAALTACLMVAVQWSGQFLRLTARK